MITIVLNGRSEQIDDSTNISQLLEKLELTGSRLAVEINQQIVPRSEFASFTFNEQDIVEIVQAIGGGSL